MNQNHKTWLEINSKKLLKNLAFYKKKVDPGVRIMAVIKANAYGHGLLEVASILKKKNLIFGVDSIDEAFMLKNAGVGKEIVILGYILPRRFAEAVENGFHISIYNKETLNTALKFPKGLFHLKVETGTNRLGINNISIFQNLDISKCNVTGIYTHFADVENKHSDFYKTQLAEFEKVLKILKSKNIFPKFIHIASTAGILRDSKTHFNMVRLGLGIYKNVLTWKTKIAQIKFIKKEESVGYNRTWRAQKNTKIAVLPVGYYDGYDRRLSNKGTVLINGKTAKIIGRVCMNMTMTDVTKIKNLKVGDNATLLGNKIEVENMAKKIGSIDYEILARLGSHLPRIII